MMKRWFSIITCCLALIFTPYAFSQDFPQSQGNIFSTRSPLFSSYSQSNTSEGGFFPRYPILFGQKRTSCPACQSLADEYNDVREDLYDLGDDLDDLEDDLEDDEDALDANSDRISQLIRSGAPAAAIAQAKARQKELLNDYDDDLDDFNEGVDIYDDLEDDLDDIAGALRDCERIRCGGSSATSTYTGRLSSNLYNLDVGVMLGSMNSSRTLSLDTSFRDNLLIGSNSQNNFDAGLQFKLMFGAPDTLRPFVYLNGSATPNSTNTLFSMPPGFGMDFGTVAKLNTNWVGRLGVGLDQPLTKGLSLSGGLGVAAINQSLTANIGKFGGGIWTISNSETSYNPTAMLGLNYNVCNSCVGGYPLILSGQVTVDRYPELKLSATDSFGNNYNFTTDPKWQYRPALVFSTRF